MSVTESVVSEARMVELLDTATIVKDSVIRKVWGKLKKELELRGYSTADIEMPLIDVFVLQSNELAALLKVLNSINSHWREEVMQEYGRTAAPEEASAFLARVGSKYFLCVSRTALLHDRHDLVGHELLHVWEDKMHLATGTLTKELAGFLQDLQGQYRLLEQEKWRRLFGWFL